MKFPPAMRVSGAGRGGREVSGRVLFGVLPSRSARSSRHVGGEGAWVVMVARGSLFLFFFFFFERNKEVRERANGVLVGRLA